MVNGEHTLEPGDEALPWQTYAELWETLRLPRARLDQWVHEGRAKWVSGWKMALFLSADTSKTDDAARRLGSQAAFDKIEAAQLRIAERISQKRKEEGFAEYEVAPGISIDLKATYYVIPEVPVEGFGKLDPGFAPTGRYLA